MRPVWAEVSLPRLRENFQAICELVGPQVRVMAVVKADAYGHGAREVARALAAEGAAWFGVTAADEAAALRDAGIAQPIALLSGFWPGEEETLRAGRLTPVVFSREQVERLENFGRARSVKMPFHLKVDTGMRRLGIGADEVAPFAAALRGCRHAEIEGLCTHLASADDSLEQTRWQLEIFAGALRCLRQQGFHPPLVHLANSAAMARLPESRGTLVRPGLALYGYQLCETPLRVSPALSLKARVVSVRQAPAGAAVGYGASYVTPAPARIATVCAGYADGVNRALSNRGRAIVRGRFTPVVGRVNMDFTLLDVTAAPEVDTGDEVVLIGRQGDAEVTAAEHAGLAGTIPYEILCNIGPRVPRVYVDT